MMNDNYYKHILVTNKQTGSPNTVALDTLLRQCECVYLLTTQSVLSVDKALAITNARTHIMLLYTYIYHIQISPCQHKDTITSTTS